MITQEYLKELVNYDRDSGVMTWKVQKAKATKIGSVVGTICNKGYLRVKIDGNLYLVHRLAWLYETGSMPDHQVDHINGNRLDNRLENLRVVTSQGNAQNRKRRTDNTSGVVGVRWHKAHCRWYAVINVDKKQKHLGYFTEFSDVVNARKNAEVLYGYHANHGREK